MDTDSLLQESSSLNLKENFLERQECTHVYVPSMWYTQSRTVRVCVCVPLSTSSDVDSGQRTEGLTAEAAQPHWPLTTLLLRTPTELSAVPAISTSPRKWREVESFTRGHRACKQQTGNQADDNGRRLSPCSLPLPSGSCTLGRGLLPGSSQGPEAATPPSSALPHCMRERVGAVTSS